MALAVVGVVVMIGVFAVKTNRGRQAVAAARRVYVRASSHHAIEKACDGTCDTYSEAAAWARREARDSTDFVRAEVGTCGTLRYVRVGGGFGSSTEFFDSAGELVAAAQTTDVVAPPCLGKTTFGADVDSCSMILVEDFRLSTFSPSGRGKPR
jgi:hypothetical protein